MPALYSHLILLQQASRSGQQSLSQRHFQEAKTAGASPGGSGVNSMHSPPHSSGGASFSNTGDTQARPSGRSDLSQALLSNTAALESNLAAAQRGDGVGFGDAGDTDTVDADLGTLQTFSGTEPTTSHSVSGACHPKVMQIRPLFGVLHDPWSHPELLQVVLSLQGYPHPKLRHARRHHLPNQGRKYSHNSPHKPQVAHKNAFDQHATCKFVTCIH